MADETKRISVQYVLDSSGFNEGLQGINANLKLNKSALKDASIGIQSFGDSTQNLQRVQDSLQDVISSAKQKVDLYKDSISKTTDKMQDNIEKRDKLKSELDMEKAKLESATKAYGSNSEVTQNCKEKVADLTQQYNDADKAVQQNAKSVESYTTKMNNAEAEEEKFEGQLKETNKQLAESQSAWIQSGEKMQNVGEKMQDVGSGMASIGNKLSIGVSLPLAGVGIAATKMAMESVESENLFDVSMGTMADSTRKWSNQVSQSLGLNAYEVRKNVGTLNTMLISMGQTKEAAQGMSEKLTVLAYDMASFYNISPDEAFQKLRSGISGEVMPLKELGIVVAENTVKQYAYQHGIAKTGKELTDAQKIQARYGVILQATGKAQGDLARTMDSPTNKLRIETEQLKQQGIELGQRLIPLAEKGMNIMGEVIKWYDSLSNSQKDQIVKLGLLAVAAGPVLSIAGNTIKIGGTLINGIGGLNKKIGEAKIAMEAAKAAAGTAATATTGVEVAATGASAATGGLAAGLGTAALAAAPWLLAGAGVVAVGVGIHHALTQQAVPAVDLFKDKVETTSKTVTDEYGNMSTEVEQHTTNISESTKKAVNSYLKLDEDAKKSLTDLYTNSTAITNNTVTIMKSKYDAMGNDIKQGMDKHFNDTYSIMQNFYKNSNTLSSTEEQKSLSDLKKSYTDKKTEVNDMENQIMQIYKTAGSEHRQLTQNEQQQINSIQNKMKTTAVQTLSDDEVQSKVILERMKDYGTRITAEQASAEIKNAEKTRQGAVQKANEQYNQTVAAIIKMRDETHSITADQAQKMIDDARWQKEQTIAEANNQKQGVVKKIGEMNSQTLNNVDSSTGKILSYWDKVKRWWNSWWPGGKSFTYTMNWKDMDGGGSSGGGTHARIMANAGGTTDFTGGLTTLHEKGYEVYQLPQHTRIYNHEASEDLVKQTAKDVAENVLSKISLSGTQTIIVPINLDGREIGRVVTPYVSNNIARAAFRR